MTNEAVPLGLYESLITERLRLDPARLGDLVASTGKVDPADQPHVLARHVYELTKRALEDNPDPRQRLTF